MKSVAAYYLAWVFSSLALWVWLGIIMLCLVLPSLIHLGGIYDGSQLEPLLRSQLVLYALWAFVVIQVGFWATRFSSDRRTSGLSVWWEAAGITGIRQFAGIVLSCWIPAVIIVCVSLVLLGAVSLFGRPIRPGLLAEQAFAMVLAAGLYTGLCTVLGTVLERSLALALGIGEFLFALEGLLLARGAAANMPEPLNSTLSIWLLFFPNFDLYFRPGAVIHFWPALPGWVLWGILAYSLLWYALLAALAKITFKPCFV